VATPGTGRPQPGSPPRTSRAPDEFEAFIWTGITKAKSGGTKPGIKLGARNAYGFHNPVK
jgi:hypothetical protein